MSSESAGAASKVFHAVEKNRPKDERDMRIRAGFYSMAVGLHSLELMRAYIDGCKEEQAMANGNLRTEDSAVHKAAVKELTVVSLWLSMLEQYVTMPEWMKEFYTLALNATDRVYPDPAPKADAILDRYPPDATVDTTAMTCSMNLASALGLSATTDDASIRLGKLLIEAARQRADLLKTALLSTPNELDFALEAMA